MSSGCRYIRRISAMCDGELETQISTELSHHLDECDECRAEYQHLLRMRGVLYRIQKMKAPKGFAGKFKQFRTENKLENWQQVALDHFITRLLPLSAIVLIIILAWAFISSEAPRPDTESFTPDQAIVENVIPASERIVVSVEEPQKGEVFRLAVENTDKINAKSKKKQKDK